MSKNDDENGLLSCRIYSSPTAAHLSLQGWVGDRSIQIACSFKEDIQADIVGTELIIHQLIHLAGVAGVE